MTYSVNSPAGLLSTIPVALGRYPSDSVVAVTIRHGRTDATLRLDKPAVMDESFMSSFVSYLANAPADTVVLAVYAGDHGNGTHYAAEVRALADYITANLPVTVMLSALVTPEHWMDYAEPGFLRPSLELEAAPVLIEMIANGHADRNVHTIPGVVVDPGFREEVRRWSDEVLEDTSVSFESWNMLVSSGATPTRAEAVRLVAGMKGGNLRDGMLVRTFADDVELEHYPAALLGTLGKFDRVRFEAALALLKHLLTLDAPEAHRASMLAGLGWLHWHAGRGTAAIECFEEGLALDPEHRLCSLLTELVNRGHLSPIASTKSNWNN